MITQHSEPASDDPPTTLGLLDDESTTEQNLSKIPLTPLRENDWIILDEQVTSNEDDDWDLCIEGEKLQLKEATESWNVINRRMIFEM